MRRVSLLSVIVALTCTAVIARDREKPGQQGSQASEGAAASKAREEAVPPPTDVAAPPADAHKTASGLAFKVLAAGAGNDHPTPGDLVTVHYTGWTTDGKMLDSLIQRGKPLTIVLKRTIPGWVEGLQSMRVGEKRRFWIPESIAFQGNPTAPNGTVVYEVELLDIQPGPDVPPPHVEAPPEDAERSPSGLAWKVLKRGTGERHPSPASKVTVRFTGWTADGKMFDSTFLRDVPSSFRLNQTIPG